MGVSQIIIRRLLNKDEDAFSTVYEAYKNLVFYVIYRILKNYEDTEETMIDSFVHMYNHLEQLRDLRNFHSWFMKIVKTRALMKLRMRPKNTILSEEIVNSFSDNPKDPLILEMIEYINESLTKEERDILILKYVYKLSMNSAAQIMDCDRRTCETLLHVAIHKLRRKMKSDYNPYLVKCRKAN